MAETLEDAMDNDEFMEIWEADPDEPVEGGENKFKGRCMQGYLTASMSLTAGFLMVQLFRSNPVIAIDGYRLVGII